MVVFDVLVYHDAFLRLSLEDLFKLWSSFFLFLFSLTFFKDRTEEAILGINKQQKKVLVIGGYNNEQVILKNLFRKGYKTIYG